MAPIRRYLRITKYSVLEVRIYLDNPSLAETWLLRQSDPALPRIIEAVRPLVLPKLREENERSKGKGKAKRGVRDVVSQDDFEVSIFLTDHSSRHSILTKQKHFEDKPRLKSNPGKLTSWIKAGGTSDKPIDVEGEDRANVAIRQEDDDEVVDLDKIPEADATSNNRRGKRHRQDSQEDLFVHESSNSEAAFEPANPRTKRKKPVLEDDDGPTDDKKKLGMNTIYDGFSIYGRILCLVVKRKGGARVGHTAAPHSSQQMMENWVSTQAVRELGDDDEDDG